MQGRQDPRREGEPRAGPVRHVHARARGRATTSWTAPVRPSPRPTLHVTAGAAAGTADRRARPRCWPRRPAAYATYVQRPGGPARHDHQGLHGRRHRRRHRHGQGAVRPGADLLRAHRAGRRELRRPRPARSTAAIDDAATPADFTGFHRLEQALWVDGQPRRHGADRRRSCTPTSCKLHDLVATETYQPAQLANGAAELLDEIAAVQGHRRGGALLAPRPARLPGQPRWRAQGVRPARAGAQRTSTPTLAATSIASASPTSRRRSTRTAPATASCSSRTLTADQVAGAGPGGRRPRRAAVAGRGEARGS